MTTLTIRLDDQLDGQLSRLAERSHRTKSDLVREMLRRERAINSPTQQLFRAIFNLEVSPKLTREASAFFTEIRSAEEKPAAGISNRDKIWAGILPNENDLKEPKKFLSSIQIPDDLSGLI